MPLGFIIVGSFSIILLIIRQAAFRFAQFIARPGFKGAKIGTGAGFFVGKTAAKVERELRGISVGDGHDIGTDGAVEGGETFPANEVAGGEELHIIKRGWTSKRSGRHKRYCRCRRCKPGG